MVMEIIPSPQSVGLEFVRQYYTLLNREPTHLHRFYNKNSTFVHGGLDRKKQDVKAVFGQQDIHHRIMQLEFRDCHAKILQVDSHSTLGEGVVVQVIGELSNNGQPMRRFVQTFVLAPQSPKKYYVHNDIFRYQDDVFSDDEDDDTSDAGTTEPETTNAGTPNGTTTLEPEHRSMPYGMQQSPTTVNGSSNIGREEHAPLSPPETSPASPHQALPPRSPTPPAAVEIASEPEHLMDEPTVDDQEEEENDGMEKDKESVVDEEEDPGAPEPVSNEPKTYANLLKSGGGSGFSAPPGYTPLKSPVSAVTTQPAPARVEPKEATPASATFTSPQAPRDPRPNKGSVNRTSPRDKPPVRTEENADTWNTPSERGGTFDAERRRGFSTQGYPDANQVFVGNLPLQTTEDELRDLFSKYGAILDLRINKQNSKMVPGNRVPNFGFVVYDNPESVKKVLDDKPIKLPHNDHRLNVEEKKVKPRSQEPLRSMSGGRGTGGIRGGMMGRSRGMGYSNRGDGRGGGFSRGGYSRR